MDLEVNDSVKESMEGSLLLEEFLDNLYPMLKLLSYYKNFQYIQKPKI